MGNNLINAVTSKRKFTIFKWLGSIISLYLIIISLISLYTEIGIDGYLHHSTLIYNVMHHLSYTFDAGDVLYLLDLIPVASYSNADTQKSLLLSENNHKAGIYRFTNKLDNKTYIGSAINLRKRLRHYYNYTAISNKKSRINRALLKYGYSNFKLEILEYCKPEDTIKREQYYLDLLKPEYNICKVAGSMLGFKHTKEACQRMRYAALNRSEETRAKMSVAKLGKKLSKEIRAKIVAVLQEVEVKAKIQAAALKRKGRELSEETKAKMKASQSKRIKHPVPGIKVEVTSIETGCTTVYGSIREAAEVLNIGPGTISRRLKLNITKPYKGKFLIKAYEG
jgi:group I intron endonuclease